MNRNMNMNRKRSTKSITAFLLSLILLFQTNTAFATAGTVSGNEPAEEEDIIEGTVSGQSLKELKAGTVTGPANPVHHCTKKDDGSDYTDFSYVYFGNYPQSEVTDSATIAAIDKTIAASGAAADAGIDVWVNGIKYRRISKNDTNYSGYFDKVSNDKRGIWILQ